LEGSGGCLTEELFQYLRRDNETKHILTIACVPADNRTEHLPSMSPERQSYAYMFDPLPRKSRDYKTFLKTEDTRCKGKVVLVLN
jgi:hypothetical protein